MDEGRAYIETGILEQYVTGQLTARERYEVEAMAAKDPEVKQEITSIELTLEKYAMVAARNPREILKDEILHKILTKPLEAKSDKIMQKIEPAIIPLHDNVYEAKIRKLYIALAACVALLAITIIALLSTRGELGEAKNEIIALNLDKQKFATEASYLKENNTDLQEKNKIVSDPDWKTVKLAGTKMDPQANMIVYWHPAGRHVMVDNSKMQLPANDQDHQYQLWALVNGKPVDLGVFDVKADSTQILLKMKEIAGAQAFAVTLEKRGGNVGPTMDQMIVMGAVGI
ncbi:anti-sigma factor [Pedobacter hiemivivus]|uniref:Anti-sigma factor n=1 Tax=Pedobacter hiemivivus TaxID=2530454 RepID=A0A4R0N685_9SPHI|nr:anti-sigma factor [Pedobacter hiemivivus]TCC95528.1 anti-sigma factor [Pedobacter hiemivivus]